MKTLVISHASCTDGFAASFAYHREFGDDNVAYLYSKYGDPIPPEGEVDKDTRVFILDFSYPRAQLELLNERAGSLLVLDHHKTAEADLKDLPYAIFDMKRSGAGMAWDWFTEGEPRHWLINYVEDRDLWNHKLTDTKEVNAYISMMPKTFEVWDRMFDMPFAEAVSKGSVLIEFIRQRNMEIASQRRVIEFCGFKNVAVVNCPRYFASEVGEILAMDHDFAIMYAQDRDCKWAYSLRSSTKGSNVDVSEVAKQWGGGGHRNASGMASGFPLF